MFTPWFTPLSAPEPQNMSSLEQEKRRKAEKPVISAERAVQLAKELYGLDVVAGSLKELDSYDDRNFYLRATHARPDALSDPRDCNGTRDGEVQHFVLKIHNGVESLAPAFIDCQNQAMICVRRGAGCWSPRALPSVHGETIARATAPLASGIEREHAVRLLPFRPSGLFADVPLTLTLLRNLGTATARLSASLADFDHPAAHREHVWDLAHAPNVRPLLVHAPAERHALLAGVLDEFESSVRPLAPQLRMAAIHGDVNDQNVLVDAGGTQVLGIIDFGDMTYSWLVNEIAIATAYALIALHYSARTAGTAGVAAPPALSELEVAIAMTSSYAAEMTALGQRGLTVAEWAVLPTLIACRITVSLIVGAYSSAQDPANEYLKLTQLPGWEALKRLRAVPAPELAAQLNAAAALLSTPFWQPPHWKKNNDEDTVVDLHTLEHRAYLEHFGVHAKLSMAIATVLKERPANPLLAVAELLSPLLNKSK